MRDTTLITANAKVLSQKVLTLFMSEEASPHESIVALIQVTSATLLAFEECRAIDGGKGRAEDLLPDFMGSVHQNITSMRSAAKAQRR
jgi:hypothetical protein